MHGADEPTKGYIVIQGLQAAPGFSSRGHVGQCEQNSGYKLEKKNGQCRASKHVPPTRSVARHGMFCRIADRPCKLQAMIEPLARSSDHPHHDFSFTSTAVGAPGVGKSPAWIVRILSSTLYGYSNNPRCGGPDARDPSR